MATIAIEPWIPRHFSTVRRRLRAKFGPGIAIPCGTTAEAAEADFVFETLPSLADVLPCPRCFYRLHFELDAENISDDHVVFAAVDMTSTTILHSYTHIHPVRIQHVRPDWLEDAADMVSVSRQNNLVETWIRLFQLEKAPPAIILPATVTCHVSRTRSMSLHVQA